MAKLASIMRDSSEIIHICSFIRLIWAVLGSRDREITSSYQYIRLSEARVIQNLITMKKRAFCRAPEKSRVGKKFVISELELEGLYCISL